MGLPSVPIRAEDIQNAQQPPEGSYAAMNLEAQRAAQMAPLAESSPPQHSPAPAPVQTEQRTEHEDTPNVQRRISELTQQRREWERRAAEAEAKLQQESRQRAEAEARAAEHQRQLQQWVEARLDDMDPEQRAAVLADARINQSLDQKVNQLRAEILPAIQQVSTMRMQSELAALTRYPGFRAEEHIPMIERRLAATPGLTVDEAFRLVASPEDLVSQRSGQQAPPVVVPRGTGTTMSSQIPAPAPDPEAEMRADAARIRQLGHSREHGAKGQQRALIEKNLRDRVFGGR